MRYGFLFAGQGAQAVGMGRELYEKSEAAREVLDLACEVVGYDLRHVCFEGPEEELNTTRVSQPAILAVSLAELRSLPSTPSDENVVAAGLSLGEYSALAAAGALSDRDAIDLVRTRGELMQKACDENPGGMVSIIGLERPAVEDLVRQAREHGVAGICNINSPNQIAVGGAIRAVERAEALAQEAGAKKVVRLRVAGAFHTALMASARDRLEEKINDTEIVEPRFPVVSNVTANYTVEPMEIRKNLINQLTSPVLWSDSMILMIHDGIRNFCEFGPGNVLRGLMRRIDRSVGFGEPTADG
jgi:[acyl-carrier-protein] S-malonyltransferase